MSKSAIEIRTPVGVDIDGAFAEGLTAGIMEHMDHYDSPSGGITMASGLTGHAGGADRKARLLAMEKADMPKQKC